MGEQSSTLYFHASRDAHAWVADMRREYQVLDATFGIQPGTGFHAATVTCVAEDGRLLRGPGA